MARRPNINRMDYKYKKILGLISAVLFLLSFAAGFWGFNSKNANNHYVHNGLARTECSSDNLLKWSHSLYLSAQLFVLQSGEFEKPESGTTMLPGNRLLHFARWGAPLSTALAILVAAWTYLVSIFNYFRSRLYKKHIIICGLGNKGWYLLDLNAKGERKKVVVIEENPDNPHLDFARKNGAYIIIGDACNKDLLIEARIYTSGKVYAVTNDDHTNINIAYICRELIAPGIDPRLVCYAHILDLRLKQYIDEKKLVEKNDTLDVRTFNVYESSTSRIVEQKYPPYLSSDKVLTQKFRITPNENDESNIIILGFGTVGESIVKSIVRYCHYINGIKTKITVIDNDVAHRANEFITQYVPDQQFVHECEIQITEDISVKFVDFDLLHFSNETCADPRYGFTTSPDVIYVCLGDDNIGVAIAQRIRRIVSKRAFEQNGIEDTNIRFVVCIERPYNKGQSKDADVKQDDNEQIYPVDMIYEAIEGIAVNIGIEEMAQAINFVYGGAHTDVLLGLVLNGKRFETANANFDEWNDLSENDRNSNRLAATHSLLKIRSILDDCYPSNDDNFTDSYISCCMKKISTSLRINSSLAAKCEHTRWVGEKLMIGYTYSKHKQIDKKIRNYLRINNDLVDWEKLDSDEKYKKEKAKDYNIINVLPELFEIYCNAVQKNVRNRI